jgi:hypothetical protein
MRPRPLEFSQPPLKLRMKPEDGRLEIVAGAGHKILTPDKRLENI